MEYEGGATGQGDHAPGAGAPAETATSRAVSVVRIAGAEADLKRGVVRAPDGVRTDLRRQSALVLAVLAGRRGEAVSKDELNGAVWGHVAVTEDSLVQCIGEIRRALGSAREMLKTIPRRGYCLEPEPTPAAQGDQRWRRPRLAAFAGLVAAALAVWILKPARGPAPSENGPVVAVLPFVNGTGGERWDRLAAGVTDEVIADLGRNDWIAVFAKATTAPHSGATPQELHGDLGADYVVTGTVQAERDRVRISAALADASTGRQVWAEDWHGEPDDLLTLQVAAAEALTAELAGSYTGAIARAGRERARASTTSLAAYDLYLIGSEHKHRFGEADLNLAKDYYLRAVALDPGFAKAWVGLSIVQGLLAGLAMTDEEFAARDAEQRTYIERAVAADPEDPSVLIEASRLDAGAGDLDAAARKIRRAVERAPNDADVLAVAAWSGPERAPIAAEALVWANRALALNPQRPDWYMYAKAQAAFASGEDAVALAAIKEGPKDVLDGWITMAAASANLGDRRQAELAVAEVRRMAPDFSLAFYLDGWPYEPGFRERLREGAVRAGLGP